MAIAGVQKGKVLKNYVKMDEKKQLYINVKIEPETEPGGFTFARIYVTDKSAGVARASLRTCGLDIPPTEDKLREALVWLGEDEDALAGKVVPIEMKENGNYPMRCNILLPGDVPASKDAIARAAHLLHAAKKNDEDKGKPPTSDEDRF